MNAHSWSQPRGASHLEPATWSQPVAWSQWLGASLWRQHASLAKGPMCRRPTAGVAVTHGGVLPRFPAQGAAVRRLLARQKLPMVPTRRARCGSFAVLVGVLATICCIPLRSHALEPGCPAPMPGTNVINAGGAVVSCGPTATTVTPRAARVCASCCCVKELTLAGSASDCAASSRTTSRTFQPGRKSQSTGL
jgi:hypothetical protein